MWAPGRPSNSNGPTAHPLCTFLAKYSSTTCGTPLWSPWVYLGYTCISEGDTRGTPKHNWGMNTVKGYGCCPLGNMKKRDWWWKKTVFEANINLTMLEGTTFTGNFRVKDHIGSKWPSYMYVVMVHGCRHVIFNSHHGTIPNICWCWLTRLTNWYK